MAVVARLAVAARAAVVAARAEARAAVEAAIRVEARVETRAAVRAVPSAVLPLWILMSSARSLERAAKPLMAVDVRLAVAGRAAVAAKAAIKAAIKAAAARAAETAVEATAVVGTRVAAEGKPPHCWAYHPALIHIGDAGWLGDLIR